MTVHAYTSVLHTASTQHEFQLGASKQENLTPVLSASG